MLLLLALGILGAVIGGLLAFFAPFIQTKFAAGGLIALGGALIVEPPEVWFLALGVTGVLLAILVAYNETARQLATPGLLIFGIGSLGAWYAIMAGAL